MSKKIDDYFKNKSEDARAVVDFRNINYYEISPQSAAKILAGISKYTVIPENRPEDFVEDLTEIIENSHDAQAALIYCSSAQPFNLNILIDSLSAVPLPQELTTGPLASYIFDVRRVYRANKYNFTGEEFAKVIREAKMIASKNGHIEDFIRVFNDHLNYKDRKSVV